MNIFDLNELHSVFFAYLIGEKCLHLHLSAIVASNFIRITATIQWPNRCRSHLRVVPLLLLILTSSLRFPKLIGEQRDILQLVSKWTRRLGHLLNFLCRLWQAQRAPSLIKLILVIYLWRTETCVCVLSMCVIGA